MPEEVERALNSSKLVVISKVTSQKSAFLGALVIADVVLANDETGLSIAEIKASIIQDCRRNLEPFKIPAIIKIVKSIKISESGKILRRNL